MFVNEQRLIKLRHNKAEFNEMRAKATILSARGLFEPIKGSIELADIIRKLVMNKTERLRHIDIPINITMQKGVLDIQLMDGPTRGEGNGED